MSISFSSFPDHNSFQISWLYHSVKCRFMKALARPLPVKSCGWNKFAIFGGTRSKKMYYSRNFWSTAGVICPEKTSIINNAGWSIWSCNFVCSDWICGTMISSMSFNDSFVLLKCFGLALSKKFFGKLYLGMLRSVFPPYMICTGKNSLVYVIPKVAVMVCLYAAPQNNYNYSHNN